MRRGPIGLKELEAIDRSWALKFILKCTFSATFLVFVYAIFASALAWAAWKEVSGFMFEVLKIIALPLATFVLGEYFGATRK